MDCPVEFRENYSTSDDEAISDTDDSEANETKPFNNNDSSQEQAHRTEDNAKSGHSATSNTNIASDVESESSESDIETDCSTDSEDGGDGDDNDENGAAAKVTSSDDSNLPHQAHCIQVTLQNGRMINVNAGRFNDFDNPMRETDGRRCVIGIINGRGIDHFIKQFHSNPCNLMQVNVSFYLSR